MLVLAAYAAHRGYFNPTAAVTIAAACAFASNQFFFWLGRRHGTALLERWPALATHSSKIRRLIELHAWLVAVAVRFAYGTRFAGPIADRCIVDAGAALCRAECVVSRRVGLAGGRRRLAIQ